MVERLVDRPGIDIELADVEGKRGSVSDALSLHLPGLIARDGARIRDGRIFQTVEQAQGAGELLVCKVNSNIESRFDTGG